MNNKETLAAIFDAISYAQRTLKQIKQSEEFTHFGALDPVRLIVEGLDNVLTPFSQYILQRVEDVV